MSAKPLSYNLNRFSGSQALARALAANTGAALAQGINARGKARLVVSGGRTPVKFFDALAQLDIPWNAVTIMLADERWVREDDQRSNAALVRAHLVQNHAGAARFVSFYEEGKSVQQAAHRITRLLDEHKAPLDAVILGLGNDGHTASLFPDAPEIEDALTDDAPNALAMHPPGQPEPRVTLTPQILAAARFLALHIEGAQKHVTLERAAHGGPQSQMPIRAIMTRAAKPLEVYWAP